MASMKAVKPSYIHREGMILRNTDIQAYSAAKDEPPFIIEFFLRTNPVFQRVLASSLLMHL